MASDTPAHTKPRLWIASELYYPEETSTGYFMTKLAEGLVSDFDVRVISGRPSYSERSVPVASSEVRNGVRIRRMASTRFDKDNVLLKLINQTLFSTSAFVFGLLHFRQNDVLLTVTNPPTLPIALVVPARLRRVNSVLLLHDVYPQVLIAAGMLKPTGTIYRLLEVFFRKIYQSFRTIIVVGRDMEEVVRSMIGDNGPHIAMITNWGDTDEIVPLDPAQNEFRREHGLLGKTVIQFSGNIGRTHDVVTILDAAEDLVDRPNVQFLFVGYGGKVEFIRSEIARRGIQNVTLLKRQPRSRLNEMLCASDATLITLVDNMFGLSVPSRMYNVMSAGVPIIAIADPRSELCLTVAEADCGWIVDEDVRKTLGNIVCLLDAPDGRSEGQRKGKNGRIAVCRKYTFYNILAKFKSELISL